MNPQPSSHYQVTEETGKEPGNGFLVMASTERSGVCRVSIGARRQEGCLQLWMLASKKKDVILRGGEGKKVRPRHHVLGHHEIRAMGVPVQWPQIAHALISSEGFVGI